MFKMDEVKSVLKDHGFDLVSSSNFGESFHRKLENDWVVAAYCSFAGNPLIETIDKENYEELSVSLFDSIGTRYKFSSLASLKHKLEHVIKTLKTQSDDDMILKCDKCKIRYVNPKEPPAGKKWKAFLSCSGMIIQGRGQNKKVQCDGTSKKIPAIVIF